MTTERALDKLRNGAQALGNSQLVSELEGLDHESTKVMYHRNCYSKYTKKPRPRGKRGYNAHTEAYEEFCRTYIDGRIIEQNKRYFLSTLTSKFVKTVQRMDGVHLEDYDRRLLKNRLGKSHPQLEYYRPKQRNRSVVVMFRNEAERKLPEDEWNFEEGADCDLSDDGDENLDAANGGMPATIEELLASIREIVEGTSASNEEDTAADDESENMDQEDMDDGEDDMDRLSEGQESEGDYADHDSDEDYCPKGYDPSCDHTLQHTETLCPQGDLYDMSKKICSVIKYMMPSIDRKDQNGLTADDVPLQLYNMLAWMMGSSDDRVKGKRVRLPPDQDKVIISVAQ